jgi:hypothetical protein
MGQGAPLEMITTCEVRAVSNGGGGDSKCSIITTNILFTLLFVAGRYERPHTRCG